MTPRYNWFVEEPKARKPRRQRLKKKKPSGSAAALPAQLEQVHLNAAGIDVGSTEHWVAVPAGRGVPSVQKFGAFTEDLYELAKHLENCGVETVAMESTGVYWIPLFEILEQHGFEVLLVDPHRLKSVPGRKSDVVDCHGSSSFTPLVCSRVPSGPRMRFACCAPTCASARCWSLTPPTTSSICRRR